MNLCKCGCGQEVSKEENIYINHHSSKIFNGMKNKYHSEESKRKMSEKQKGRKHTEETRRKISEKCKGKTLSKETRKKLSEARKGIIFSEEHKKKLSEYRTGKYCGENHPNWKGGISCEPYCIQWSDKEYKYSINERDKTNDKIICLNPCCNRKSNKLCIHHINYDKKDCRPVNLITICSICNTKANSNREWHQAWYSAIIYRRYFSNRRK